MEKSQPCNFERPVPFGSNAWLLLTTGEAPGTLTFQRESTEQQQGQLSGTCGEDSANFTWVAADTHSSATQPTTARSSQMWRSFGSEFCFFFPIGLLCVLQLQMFDGTLAHGSRNHLQVARLQSVSTATRGTAVHP